MNKKMYEIKRKGKVIGRFEEHKVFRMLETKEFSGDEIVKKAPDGEWMPIVNLLKELPQEDPTIYQKIEKIREGILKEERKKKGILDKELLKENVEFRVEKSTKDGKGSDVEEDEIDVKDLDEASYEFSETQIRVSKKNEKKTEESTDLDKTVVRPLTKQERLEVERLQKEKRQEQVQEKTMIKEEKAIVSVNKNEVISFEDKTMVGNLRGIKRKIISEVKKSEEEIRREKDGGSENSNEEMPASGEKEIDSKVKEKTEKENNSKNRTKRPFFITLAAIFLGLLLMEVMDTTPKDKKVLGPISPKIIFPSRVQFKEPKKSKELEKKGDTLYRGGGYLNTLKAAQLYANSLGYDFDNKPALGKLILTYSELYRDSTRSYRDSEVLMKLIRIAERKIPNDINYISGAALFFHQIERPRSAINTIEKYLKVNKSPTVKLIRYYMNSLIKMGMQKESKEALKQLEALNEKSVDAYLGITEYYMGNEDFKKARSILKEGREKHVKSVGIMMGYGEVLLQEENFSELSVLLKEVKKVSFGRSVYFYAYYLKYMGIIYAVKKDQKKAINFLKKSLNIVENAELRKKLEVLEVEGNPRDEFSLFINENKTIRLVQRSRQALQQEDFNKAIAYAIKAVDLNSQYYPAVRQLAKTQRIKGQFQNAINLLKRYIEKNSFSIDAKLDLLEVYIHAFRFSSAKEILSEILEISPEHERRYKFLLGKYYLFRKNYIPAITKLQEAIDIDPINDEIFFMLAELYSHHHKFKEAKSLVIRAIELNPGVVAYRSLYGHILYQIDGVDVAIGYVRKLLQEFKDHPRLMGDIAKYYYKSGQQKQFEDQLKKIKSLSRRSTDLYRSLFENALLEGDAKEMIKYGKELTRWSPGDLRTNLEFSERLIEIKEYDEALKILYDTVDRLPSFPRLYYLISKIYLAKGDIPKAIKYINKEIENNPYLPDPHILLGQIYLKQKDLGKAKQHFTEAQRRGPEDPEALYGMGYISFLLRQYEEALQLFQKGAKVVPDEPKMRLMLGYTYVKMGQRELARESFKTYLELYPNAPDKGEIQAKINELR